jgi:hypothetical protein
MVRNRAYEVVDKNDYTILLGFVSTHPSNYDTQIEYPKCWRAALELEKYLKQKFELNFPDY